MEIREKIILRDKQEANLTVGTNLKATLIWKTSVDLDLMAFYQTKSGQEDRVFYGRKGSLNGEPFISLDGDAGVGDKVDGDFNEENMRIAKLDNLNHVFIVANIYGKSNANFVKYGSAVRVVSGEQQFEVPLTSTVGGSWAIIAHLDNTDMMGPKLKSLNMVSNQQPSMRSLLGGNYQEPQKKAGFLGRLFGG